MHTGPHATRQKLLLFVLGVMWIVLAGQLWIIQFVDHAGHKATALNQRVKPFTIEARRGNVLDRNGVVMAVSRVTASYGISPLRIKNKNETAKLLVEASGKSYGEISGVLDSDKNYLWLVRQAAQPVVEKLDRLKLTGLHKHNEFNRYYPLEKVGAQIIGITDIDGYGIEGCELYFNDDLMGRDGRSTIYKDANGKSSPSLDEPVIKPQNGLDVVLTIDSEIQQIAEAELEACLEKTNARWGGAIVLDAVSGEILAMANVPGINPNHTGALAKNPGFMRNRLVTDMIEPGSVFKIVVFSEILESGLLDMDDEIDCEDGKYRISRHVIHDTHELGVVPVRDVLIHSSNIGTVKIAEKLGKKILYERARLLGFGEVTGIDFPYETPGELPNPRKWSKLSLPTISFGQGVSVSPLQIVMAYGAIANGGMLMIPRIVREIKSGGERPGHISKPQKIRRAMSASTARRLTELLLGVVEEGTGKNAALPDVRIAGKTGTAQRIEEGKKGYMPGCYISSFVGFLPDVRSKIVCLVMIDSPKGVYYGSHVAAPVFRNIINRTLNLGGKYRERMLVRSDTGSVSRTVNVPDVRGKKIPEVIEEFRTLGLNAEVFGDSTVVTHQIPFGGARLNAGSVVTLYSDSFSTDKKGHIKVPDLIGKSMREAVQNLVKVNLDVNISGSGIVIAQNPRPGTFVNHGTICMISCGKR